jgi:hypothetical protein
MADQKLTPSELRSIAQQLIRSGNMPSPDKLAEAMGEAQKDYAAKLKRMRETAAK